MANPMRKNTEFKFDAKNFTTFNDKLLTILSSTYGCRNCTLEYLTRLDDGPMNGPLIEELVPDVCSPDVLSSRVTLFGNDFSCNNKQFYSILRTYLTDTTGWNLISPYSTSQNGRTAHRALCNHFQGSTHFNLLKTKAMTMMTNTFY